jgi:voltage-gated potassium channel Kch
MVVAVSMLLTPLSIIFYDKILVPCFIKHQKKLPYDNIIDSGNPVIIAGFGRYGQIIGRLLMANKIKTTVLDLDSENIELIKKFGFKVFYGDAGRLDLLETAGIKDAKIFILAIDDSERALEIAIQIKHKYPHLKILSRVRGRTQAYEFLKEEFESIYRETFESSLSMSIEALKILGFTHEQAQNSVRLFKEHDQLSLKRLFKLYGKENEYIMAAKQDRKNLENAFEADKLNIL